MDMSRLMAGVLTAVLMSGPVFAEGFAMKQLETAEDINVPADDNTAEPSRKSMVNVLESSLEVAAPLEINNENPDSDKTQLVPGPLVNWMETMFSAGEGADGEACSVGLERAGSGAGIDTLGLWEDLTGNGEPKERWHLDRSRCNWVCKSLGCDPNNGACYVNDSQTRCKNG